ncbi:MAG: hypothetical protein ACOC5T_04950 [Elusimicrobiota bacterium]
MLNVVFSKKTPVFLYYNHIQFEQNAIAHAEEGVEGFSEVFKNRLVLPMRYSKYDMNHLIAHEYVHIAQFELLYGGFWKSAKLIKGLSGLTPLWIMEGMAESVSHRILNLPWSSYDKMILRDAVIYDYLYTLRELQNFTPLYRDIYLGYKLGHSAMDYLVEQEGEKVYFNLMKSLRNNIDPIKAFEVGVEKFVSLRDFDLKWRKHLEEETNEFVEDKEKVSDVSKVLVTDEYHSRNPSYKQNGEFYYVSDRWIQNEIYLHSGSEEKRVLPGFVGSDIEMIISGRRYDRIIDYNNKTNLLVFIGRKKLKDYLYIYNTKTKKLIKKKFDIAELRSPAISENGNYIVFSGLKNAKRNLYLYDLKNENVNKITDDNYIDYAPVFSPDSKYILTSTERNLNTDLREIDILTKQSRWLTNTPYNEIHPIYMDKDSIVYSADKNSVYNLYNYDIKKSSLTPLTNVQGGIFYPAKTKDNNLLLSSYFNNSYKISSIDFNLKPKDIKNKRNYIESPSTSTITDPITDREPYKFKFSTDFFFPSFLYSTDIGFIGGGYYKASDMLGYHDFSLYGWAWPGVHDFLFQYTLKKWYPNIFLLYNSKGEEYGVRDESDDIIIFKDTSHHCELGYQYPLNSYLAFSNWITAQSLTTENLTQSGETHSTETGIGLQITRNTSQIRPFHAVEGSIFSLSAYTAKPIESRGIDYNQYESIYKKYTPFSQKLTLASKISLARTDGPDSSNYYLDSKSSFINPLSPRLRGYSRKHLKGKNLFSLTNELRLLAYSSLNWHIYFMWPDINIYSLSLNLFQDAGTCWMDEEIPDSYDDWGLSWGVGIKLNLYILQLAPLFINFEIARPVVDSNWKTYWTISSSYIKW